MWRAPDHQPKLTSAWQFAIRPTIRENTSLDRDRVIELVGGAITKGENHTVDLKNYDVLVLVDVYRVSTSHQCF